MIDYCPRHWRTRKGAFFLLTHIHSTFYPMRNVLHFTSATSDTDLRTAIVECGQICYGRGLMTSNDGNISVRLGGARVLITASGICKGRMGVEDLLILDLDGKVLSSDRDSKPSSEAPMHLEAYRQRPDVGAVIHSHPIFATALTVAGMEFPADILPEVILTLGSVPTTDYGMPGSHDDAEIIRPWIRNHDALLLRQHGSLTVGKDLDEALINLERIEHVAEVFWRAFMLGTVNRIPPDMMEKLRERH
jgi:L-fuculose-phosphate aldolase